MRPKFWNCLPSIWMFGICFSQLAHFMLVASAKELAQISSSGIGGTLVIVGGGSIPERAQQEFVQSLGDEGTVVVIATASAEPLAASRSASSWLTKAGAKQVSVPEIANDRPADPATLAAAIGKAKGVWICGGQQSRLAQAYQGTMVESALRKLVDAGGVIGGTSAGAAIMSRVMIASGREKPVVATGFNLLPGAIIDQHFTQRNRMARSRRAVLENPQCFGLGIDEATAVIVSGRSMEVVGAGTVTLLRTTSARLATTQQVLRSGEFLDLTQLRRAASMQALGLGADQRTFGVPAVTNGSLVIVGGGEISKSIAERFIQLAGGESARVVVLPTAVAREQAFRSKAPGFLEKAEVAEVKVLPHSRPDEIASEEFQQALKFATGIWFGGGRQWNFLDAYEETNAIELFRECLQRGGVVGGSSAGATIQGEYLVRGHPHGNSVMMAPGYERGFSFLPGTAIDQHFSQRARQPDLIPVIRRFPRLLGIGIDESTALIVQGSTAEVVGEHAVHLLSGKELSVSRLHQDEPTSEAAAKLYLTFRAGDRIDLQSMRVEQR